MEGRKWRLEDGRRSGRGWETGNPVGNRHRSHSTPVPESPDEGRLFERIPAVAGDTGRCDRLYREKTPVSNRKLRWGLLICLSWMVITTACRQDMHDQPRFEPLEQNSFFGDNRASRPLVAGTVPRGYLRIDDHLYEGKQNGELVNTFPFPITKEILARGRERYDIFCSPCHDKTGSGQGMIVQRGFRAPPSFHLPRLRNSPVGHFYDVITNGLGAMYDYRERIKPKDRWAIVAYVRALQLSQRVTIDEAPADIRQQLLGN
ncbi:MAG: c-type cytochrome [bacterium]